MTKQSRDHLGIQLIFKIEFEATTSLNLSAEHDLKRIYFFKQKQSKQVNYRLDHFVCTCVIKKKRHALITTANTTTINTTSRVMIIMIQLLLLIVLLLLVLVMRIQFNHQTLYCRYYIIIVSWQLVSHTHRNFTPNAKLI